MKVEVFQSYGHECYLTWQLSAPVYKCEPQLSIHLIVSNISYLS